MPIPDVIDIAGNKIIAGPGISAKTLSVYLPATTGTTMHDADTGADYVVPAGKTLRIFQVQGIPGGSTRVLRLEQTPNPDDLTGGIVKVQTFTVIGAGAVVNLGVQLSFAENTYPTAYANSTSSGPSLVVVGIES